MRLPLLPPDQLSPEQRPLYDDMKAEIAAHLQGFVSETPFGALVGPFNPMLRFPAWGGPAWAQTKSMMAHTVLPKPAHEVAILAVGTVTGARYELYAHERVAAGVGLSDAKIATIVAGGRPADLTSEEAAAYDAATALARGGPLPGATYRAAVAAFGEEGFAELAYLVGTYLFVSTLLNAYDVPVPDEG